LKDTATVVVKRLDTNGCSSAYLSGIASELGKWTTWQIIGGTKVIGLASSNFYYLINRSGSSMTLTAPPNFRSRDIVGTIRGNTFTGTFKNDDPNSGIYGQTHGSVEITFSSDGKHFTGKMMDKNWGSEPEWGGDKVSEIGPSPAPSSSTPIAQWLKGSGSLMPAKSVAEGH
jgi:hypothetical protein